MNYAGFKDFLTTHLWKQGDSVVIAALDTLIQMADNELNRSFKVERRALIADIVATSPQMPVPDDFREMRHLTCPSIGDFEYLIPADFAQMDRLAPSGVFLPYYTMVNNVVWLIGSYSPETPQTMTMTYYSNLPNFKTIDTSWMADEYLDVYAYCCLKHTAPFLREDERIPLWQQMFGAAFDGAMAENDDRKYAGSPLKIKFPSGVR